MRENTFKAAVSFLYQAAKGSVGIIMKKIAEKKDFILFAVCAVICYLVFQQGDIRHTGGCSFAYLQGHILDFYEWNVEKADMYASYMPSTYILFAIWNIPVKLLGILNEPKLEVSYWLMMYYKLLPTLFYLGSSVLIYKIIEELSLGKGRAKLAMYAFLTAPIGFYSQFLFGQYDSFTVFFTLLGVYYYVREERFRFVLFFALAIPFKYFPLLVFVPLLLLKEKNIWKIIRDMVLVAIPYVVELVFYFPSELFRDYVLGFTPTEYVYSASLPTGSTNLSLVICAFCLICAWAYFKNVTGKVLSAQWMCFFATLSCTVIFGLAQWHPQWLLFAVPFWVLGAMLHKDTKVFWALDVLMMLFFCIYLCGIYINNADQAMFEWGILGKNMYGKEVMPYLNRELRMWDIYPLKNNNISGTIFAALMTVAAVFQYPPLAQGNLSQEITKGMRALHIRFLSGLSIFVVPAIICYLVAALPPYLSLDISNGRPEVPMVGDTVTQVFTASDDDIVRVEFYQGTYARINTVPLYVMLSEMETGREIASIVYDTSKFKNNSWVSFPVKEGQLKAGIQYRIDFVCPEGTILNTVCLFRTEAQVDETTYYMESGTAQNYNLCIRLYRKNRG